MCDKKNIVLFTDTECVVLSLDFKLTDESHVLLKAPRKDNMYSVDLNNVVPQGGLTCLFVKATPYEYNLWHRRLGHVNFKIMNKLAKVVNTACYVQNRVLVIKPYNKTPNELFLGRKPALSFMRPFGCTITILNTIDHLDALTKSMNYKPVVAGDQSNGNACTKACNDADSKSSPDAGFKPSEEEEKKDAEDPGNEDSEFSSTKEPRVNVVDLKSSIELTDDQNMLELEDIVYSDDDEDVGAEAVMNNGLGH
ncbi:ribonuclease H-like domain-containing protein [Tanacetum coccineum]